MPVSVRQKLAVEKKKKGTYARSSPTLRANSCLIRNVLLLTSDGNCTRCTCVPAESQTMSTGTSQSPQAGWKRVLTVTEKVQSAMGPHPLHMTGLSEPQTCKVFFLLTDSMHSSYSATLDICSFIYCMVPHRQHRQDNCAYFLTVSLDLFPSYPSLAT